MLIASDDEPNAARDACRKSAPRGLPLRHDAPWRNEAVRAKHLQPRSRSARTISTLRGTPRSPSGETRYSRPPKYGYLAIRMQSCFAQKIARPAGRQTGTRLGREDSARDAGTTKQAAETSTGLPIGRLRIIGDDRSNEFERRDIQPWIPTQYRLGIIENRRGQYRLQQDYMRWPEHRADDWRLARAANRRRGGRRFRVRSHRGIIGPTKIGWPAPPDRIGIDRSAGSNR